MLKRLKIGLAMALIAVCLLPAKGREVSCFKYYADLWEMGVLRIYLENGAYRPVTKSLVRDFKPVLLPYVAGKYDCNNIAEDVRYQFKKKHGEDVAFWKLYLVRRDNSGRHVCNVFFCDEDKRYYTVNYPTGRQERLSEYMKEWAYCVVFDI